MEKLNEFINISSQPIVIENVIFDNCNLIESRIGVSFINLERNDYLDSITVKNISFTNFNVDLSNIVNNININNIYLILIITISE
jgi:hypothetical protein